MKKGNRRPTLAYSNTNFNLQKGTKETTLNHLEKNTTATKTTWVLPICDQHGVYEALSRRLQAWKKVHSFCEPDHCLFVVVWVMYNQCPAAQWSDPRRCSCPCAPPPPPPGLCVAPRTHVTEGRLENPPFYLQSTPKETAVSRHTTCSPPDWGLGPYNRALS